MKSFQERKMYSITYETEILKTVEELGFNVAKNGTEHTHSDFVSLLRRSTDQTSLSIRYQPDAVCNIHYFNEIRSFYLEIKNSKFIEKLAYEQYMKLYNNGNIVVIVFENRDWTFVENLKLISGQVYVSKYSNPYPVDEDDWICPRCSPDSNWVTTSTNGSGTSYRYVNENTLYDFSYFKFKIIDRLFPDILPY
ncbi:MAG: hypothetical protein ACK4TA_10875 [Saprospiraceae bacterium]